MAGALREAGRDSGSWKPGAEPTTVGGHYVRTFETLPRVEPGLGAGSAGEPEAGSAPGKARTLATLPKSRGRRLEPPLGVGRAEGSPRGGRAGTGGRDARHREKRRPSAGRALSLAMHPEL